jgi:beta-lactam-binding protein with PASTA domain/Ca2+-binding RTX toxin-like protein
MRVKSPFKWRRSNAAKRWAVAMMIGMALSPITSLLVQQTTVQAQTAPTGAGFVIDADDLRFIYDQILVAQDHAAGGNLLGPGPNQVADPQLPRGLRTVDGSFNNLVPVPDQHMFGAADRLFPRLLTPRFRQAQNGTSYQQIGGTVIDSEPRTISNLIVDQSANNPAAQYAHDHPCGQGGFVCGDPAPTEPGDPTNSLFIPNITPDFGLSAPFNLMFTFFGQFFDHGLDLVPKSGGAVMSPLRSDDPLFVPGSQTNFMVMTRGEIAGFSAGPDGQLGTADDVRESINQTTPWVDQNQTYTSHPSHQVFLRQYVCATNPTAAVCGGAAGAPIPDGKVLDGGHCAPRGTGFAGDEVCNIGNWAEVKAQAARKLGILFSDRDVLDVPLVVTDPYGHFKPGPDRGMPMMVRPGNVLVEGNPAAPVAIPADAFRTGHSFLNDIAHNAVPVDANNNSLPADTDTTICDFRATPSCQQPGTYDDELLNAHFVTGDGRGNENIALSMVHQLFHAEHNRIASEIDHNINLPVGANGRNAFGFTAQEQANWHALHAGSGWGYGERLFQAARFGTEMQYQHLVFEEFARKVQPLVNPFLGGLTNFDPAIMAEFAHTVYRLGHSMLPEVLHRENADGTDTNIRLFNAFLNPQSYNRAPGDPQPVGGVSPGVPSGSLTAAQAAGTLINGLSKQVANELDEFVTSSVRNTLVGLPLDLPAINIARGRSEGIPGLNEARKQLFARTHDSALRPYATWFEFGQGLRHSQSLVNFIAAYATVPAVQNATTVAGKRTAANALLGNQLFMFADTPTKATAAGCTDPTCGLDNIDFWVGGLAERQAAFGGLLGSTFNYVFEAQLEHLQDFDRFYYLQRTDGLNFVQSLEGNSLAELARRNSASFGSMDNIFNTADFSFSDTTPDGFIEPAGPGDPPNDPNTDAVIVTQPDGTKLFFDPLHTGKNIVYNGGAGNDRFKSDIGDDTLYGNAGNDRFEGNDGNDTLLGGDGDDILFGGNGDDVVKGGPGNDAMESGPGFGADLLIGGAGNDFMAGGDDGNEFFGGPGDDVVVDGSMRAEAILGGDGDDWLFDGEGHDGGMFGDGGNVFDLLAGLSAVGGNDVMGGGPGQDNHFGEGGDDVMVMSEGSNKFFGDYGFDWITLRGWAEPNFIELSLLANPLVNLNFNDLRNVYRFVDGASGWDLDDHIAGSNNVLCDPPGEVAECLIPGMELRAGSAPVSESAIGVAGQVNFRRGSGAANIAGLTQLMGATGFNKNLNDPAVPGVKGVGFMGGDILLGGKGNDILEGKKGDDLIDGDRWMNVQLRAVLNDGSIKLVNDPTSLRDDVFSDPQRLNPGNISIVRSIITPTDTPPADCAAAAPRNCDTAVFAFPRADYEITLDGPRVIVTHVPAVAADVPGSDGSDTLLNIERLQFADITIPVPSPLNTVPNVIGLTQAAATTAIRNAGLLVGTITTANSPTIPIGRVIASDPRSGFTVPPNTRVDLVISLGTIVPLVTGLDLGDVGTRGTALNQLDEAGLVGAPITFVANATVPANTVISQGIADGTTVEVGTSVALVVSSGPPPVTVLNVVGQTQAAATAALQGQGLTVSVTFANSTTVAGGLVISQTPTGGSSAARGSNVALVISLGTAPTIATFVTRNTTAANTIITSPAFAVAANTLVVAFVSLDGPSTTPATNANQRQNVNNMTNSGTALTWTRAAQANAQSGDSEIWWAFAPTARTSLTVNAVYRFGAVGHMTVVGFTGAQNTLVGAASAVTNKGTGVAGDPSISLPTTKPNSWLFGVGNDWDNRKVVTANAGTTIVGQGATTITDTFFTVRTTNPQPTSGSSATIGVSGLGTDRYNFAVIEIRQP